MSGSVAARAAARVSPALQSVTLPAARWGTRARRRASASGGRTRAASVGGGELGAGADGVGEGGGVEGGGEGGAVLADLDEERVGVVGGELAGEAGEAGRVGGGELVEDLLAQRAGLAVLEDAEPGATPASSGKRRMRASQKAWMVWMRRPPGVSSARAKRVRAWARSGASGSPRRASAWARSASGSIDQAPRVRKRRFCISAAAALV